MVKEGTYRENVVTDHGTMTVYEDPFDGAVMFVSEKITGYRVKKPEEITPAEPKATVTPLFPQK